MSLTLWNRVTIVGCGLIGASFALALRRNNLCASIAGWDTSDSALNEALERKVIDEVDCSFDTGGVSKSDLIYLATPVRSIIEFLQHKSLRIKPGAVITDAGSTKEDICNAAAGFLTSDRHFVGGHPIAGSHQSGLSHACPNLFENAPYVLIPPQTVEDHTFSKVEKTIEALGSQVFRMRPTQHDQIMSSLSHLPQIVSVALSETVRKQLGSDFFMKLTGPGYRDMTRLAESSWAIWEDILRTNACPIADALDLFAGRILAVSKELRDHEADPSAELSQARRLFKGSK